MVNATSSNLPRLVVLVFFMFITVVFCYPKSKSFPVEQTSKHERSSNRRGNGSGAPSGHGCEFALQSIPGFTPIVKTDKNGKSCRADFLLPFCYGLCKTRESGTHIFPYREQEGYVCGLIGNEYENVPLTDCDEGADPSIRHILISKSTTCGCKKLPVTL